MSPNLLARSRLLESRTFRNSFPVLAMDPQRRIGFYSHFWGLGMVGFGWATLDQIQLYQVVE